MSRKYELSLLLFSHLPPKNRKYFSKVLKYSRYLLVITIVGVLIESLITWKIWLVQKNTSEITKSSMPVHIAFDVLDSLNSLKVGADVGLAYEAIKQYQSKGYGKNYGVPLKDIVDKLFVLYTNPSGFKQRIPTATLYIIVNPNGNQRRKYYFYNFDPKNHVKDNEELKLMPANHEKNQWEQQIQIAYFRNESKDTISEDELERLLQEDNYELRVKRGFPNIWRKKS